MKQNLRMFLQTTTILLTLGIAAQAQPTLVTEVPVESANFESIGSLIYFTVGNALWRTDGTAQGTFEVETGFAGFADFTEFNGKLIFKSGKIPVAGRGEWSELWVSDGTPAGTVLLKRSNDYDLNIGPATTSYLFFGASDAATGWELYRTNGTVTGTALVKDLLPGTGGGFGGVLSAAPIGNQLFFAGNDGTSGMELWKTDGTSANTVIVTDINPGANSGVDGKVFAFNNQVFFRANNGVTGWEPWASNGSAAGTFMLKDVNAGSGGVGAIEYEIANNGFVYFLVWPGPDQDPNAPDLWKSSGTTPSTVKLQTLGFPENSDEYYGFLTYQDDVYFVQHEGNFSDVFWKSDGTPDGTNTFFRFNDTPPSGVSFFDVVKDHLLFTGSSQSYPFPLHRHDGNETEIIYRFRSGGFTGGGRNIFTVPIKNAGDLAFFADHEGEVNDGGTPSTEQDYFHLYQTDGVSTQSIRALYGVNITGVKHIADFNGKVIFTTHDDYFAPVEDFQKLWIYDPQAPANTGAGKLSVETWNEVPGTHVSSIPLNAPPSSTSEITIFETPKNIGDNYGSRVRGYVIPPTTGNYVFWIASDDRSELWLSTDADPANKARIAAVSGWTTPRQWDKYTSQKSAPISLVAGRKYYVEALLKEGTGGDHLAVGWQLPNGTLERPIPGSRLAAFETSEPPSEPCAGTGLIRQEFWTNVTGTRVSDIPTDSEPDFTQDLNMFEGPASPVGDNYGSRIRGYICPKTAGEYTFWISGDDQVELWLSTDDNPANKRRIAYHNGWTQKREWDRYATQQSAPITLEPGQRYYIEALMKEGSGADHVSVGWQFPGGFVQRPIIGDYLIPFEASEAPPTACEGTGTISVETWTGIDGTRVSSIPVNTAPNLTGERNIFEAPTNVGSNFGSRFRGYVCVPTTGNYTFWIASDDHSELWLSTDNDPANKRLIANVAGWTTPRQWDKYTTQQSAPIPLVAGQQYYIEALYKEDEGGDNMAVGWQLPDGTMERPIPGNRLSPFEDATSTMAARTSAEQELYQQINVYPNPIRSGDAQLTISGYEGIDKIIETDVEIMNMTGEVVFSEKVLCGGNCGSYLMKLNEQLVPGVYVVNMQTNGVRTAKRLLVK